jgi:hypothetical protein
MRRRIGDTERLSRFLKASGIRPLHLADTAGISRQHLGRLRAGLAEPTRPVMVWLRIASGRLLRRPVRMSELFDLGDDEG